MQDVYVTDANKKYLVLFKNDNKLSGYYKLKTISAATPGQQGAADFRTVRFEALRELVGRSQDLRRSWYGECERRRVRHQLLTLRKCA